MRRRNRERNIVVTSLAIIVTVFGLVWAASYINNLPAVGSQKNILPQQTAFHPVPYKTRAPEPSTLALISSALMGMILNFVRRKYKLIKRGLDVVISVVAIIILSPIELITAILVKRTSSGPVFYFQERLGKDGVPFNMIKFRTMKVDAEKDTGPVWARKNDPRLTPIGNFLRKTHIDEVPQFINVLRGEMSVVGPRPERPAIVEKLKTKIPDYEKRLAVKPGITGLAQIRHQYDETIDDVKKKVKYDFLYIKKVCLWTDFAILLRTFTVIVTGQYAR